MLMEQINPIIEQKRKLSEAIGVNSVFKKKKCYSSCFFLTNSMKFTPEFYYLCILFSTLFKLLAMVFKQFVTIILFEPVCTCIIQHYLNDKLAIAYSEYFDSAGKRSQKRSKLYDLWCSSITKYRLKNTCIIIEEWTHERHFN